jgi:hypothetical protein
MPDGTVDTVIFGSQGNLPVIGDWNADGVSDLGVWNPTTGIFSERLGPVRTASIRFGRLR